ncbi:MAG: glycoside hydrolase N-terminal domain-containing protein, partial [Clostridia bacterium]|nr:glycoside hydrolase N-terminal domain-containing protein [Clostridia bacterium]
MNLRLHYQEPAPNTLDGWERFSVPVGCGYLGANIFGGIARERIQITENTLANPYEHGEGGLTSFADIYIDFDDEQTDALQYERGLDLDHALAYVRYEKDGRHVEREYFASYPDRSLNGRITADQPFDCRITLDIPYLITDTDDQTDDDSWFKTKNRQDIPKYGTVTAESN